MVNDDCELQNIQVVQIWCDPNYPDAHRDPALRRWLFRRAEEGIAALVRFNAEEALTIFAPPFDENGEWHESSGASTGRTHSLLETIKALSGHACNMGAGNDGGA
ncbi:hypothetical protein Q3C01_05175 [Bradyrhizobium sp. UFLA05-109]